MASLWERLTTPDTLSRGGRITPGDPWQFRSSCSAAPERALSKYIGKCYYQLNTKKGTIGGLAPQLLQPAGSPSGLRWAATLNPDGNIHKPGHFQCPNLSLIT
jgi:hypothetical protein